MSAWLGSSSQPFSRSSPEPNGRRIRRSGVTDSISKASSCPPCATTRRRPATVQEPSVTVGRSSAPGRPTAADPSAERSSVLRPRDGGRGSSAARKTIRPSESSSWAWTQRRASDARSTFSGTIGLAPLPGSAPNWAARCHDRAAASAGGQLGRTLRCKPAGPVLGCRLERPARAHAVL